MPKLNLYKLYLKQENWKCSKGGGHYWVCQEEAALQLKSKTKFKCIKCDEEREFYTTYDSAAAVTARKLGTSVGLMEVEARAAITVPNDEKMIPAEMILNLRKRRGRDK